jgi:phage repressor protein C with HTH and peptisase S24 domain/DNA-binding XRE family transcriptional regulator
MAGNNVAAIRKQRGLSQTELAERIGTTLNMLGKLERGDRTLDTDWLDKIARELNCDPRDLIAPAAPATRPDHSQTRVSTDDDIVEIIGLDLSLSMGPGTLIEEFVEAEPVKIGLRFVQDITRTPSNRLRFVTGIGDSMEPTLRHGDRVLVDINERQLTRMNGIYWIDHFGAHGIKRLRAAGKGRVMVMSDNPTVPDFEVGADELRIEGRIVWFARGL